MEQYKVTAVKINSNMESEITVFVDEAETGEDIIISANVNGNEIKAQDYNYLPAFQKFRDILLAMNIGLKCNGSRINAVQSGMMGANDNMYLVQMGKTAMLKDIVHIWDYADIDEFPGTDVQKEYIEKWADSLKSGG